MKLDIVPYGLIAPSDRDVEVVERKGVGHPDTLCDAISETASRFYSRYCIEQFGRVPHHWFDKVMLLGGEADIDYGVGRLTQPFRVIVAGKAARAVGNEQIPISDLLKQAATSVLETQLTGFVASEHLIFEDRVRRSKGPGQGSSRYSPGSAADLDSFGSDNLVSNDCNLCVGFAPLSPLERVVLETEKYLQSPDLHVEMPFIGHDIKLVGMRNKKETSLLVNVPFLAREVKDFADYTAKCDRIQSVVEEVARRLVPNLIVQINPERRWGRAYLTVTGTVADTGDVGVTGRGNRQNGLITPTRPMSMEATAGKNPLDHTGKLYGVIARDLASEIADALKTDVVVSLTTSKGAKLTEPDGFSIEIGGPEISQATRADIARMAENAIRSIASVSERLVLGNETLW